MPTSGDGTNSDGRKYSWDIAGFGELEGKWHKRSPSESTIRDHKADASWGMLIHYHYTDGSDGYFFIHGGYEPDYLPDMIDLYMEDYG